MRGKFSFRTSTVAALVGFGMLLSGTAFAATGPAAPTARPTGNKYCYSDTKPVSPGSRDLVITKTTCSDEAVPGTVLPKSRERRAATVTLLITLFSEQDYHGNYTTLGGEYGTCDPEGYKFSDLDYANFFLGGITSYKLNGACRYSTIWTQKSFAGSAKGFSTQNIRYVGTPWNDNVRSMKIGS